MSVGEWLARGAAAATLIGFALVTAGTLLGSGQPKDSDLHRTGRTTTALGCWSLILAFLCVLVGLFVWWR